MIRYAAAAAILATACTPALAEKCSLETVEASWQFGFCPIYITKKGEMPSVGCLHEAGSSENRRSVSGRMNVKTDCSITADIVYMILDEGGIDVKVKKSLEGWISGDRTRIDGLIYANKSDYPEGLFTMIRQSGLK
jgi:hypothetical protein